MIGTKIHGARVIDVNDNYDNDKIYYVCFCRPNTLEQHQSFGRPVKRYIFLWGYASYEFLKNCHDLDDFMMHREKDLTSPLL